MPGRILVVDDSPTILKVVSAILGRAGYDALVAKDGLLGLKLLAESGPVDLVLLDFVMPRMNGFQFCRELRKSTRNESVPVVLMSAKSDRIRDQFVQQTSAVDAIAKPFDARALVAVVEHALAKAKAGVTQPLEPIVEDSFDEEQEPRPSVVASEADHRAASLIARHLSATLTPVLSRMAPAEASRAEAIDRVIARALLEQPLGPLLAKLREIPGTTSREVLSGDLARVPIAEVLQLLQMQQQTGTLHVESSGRRADVYLRDGAVDLAQSKGDRAELRVGRLFVETGALTRAEVEAASERAKVSPSLLGDELVASGKVSDDVRRRALTRVTEEVVYDVVRWLDGRFRFTRDPHPAEVEQARLGLAVAGLILEGFRRVDEWRLMEGTIVWDDVVRVDLTRLGRVEASLTRPEKVVLGTVDGSRTVRQIVADCELTTFDALKIVYQFLSSRVLYAIPAARPSETSLSGLGLPEERLADRSSSNPPPMAELGGTTRDTVTNEADATQRGPAPPRKSSGAPRPPSRPVLTIDDSVSEVGPIE